MQKKMIKSLEVSINKLKNLMMKFKQLKDVWKTSLNYKMNDF